MNVVKLHRHEYWGIDAEGKSRGLQLNKNDVYSIQISPSTTEEKGIVFWSPEEFKKWLIQRQKNQNRPKRFYAFTLSYEYGSLSAWELLDIGDAKGKQLWQAWADEPVNLFYIRLGKIKIPVIDTRAFFFQLRHGNDYLTNLEAVGDYLSDYYKKDIHKLPSPLGADFGKRPPTTHERACFSRYGIRDAFIAAKAGQWINEIVVQKWLKGKAPIEKLYSWGTVSRCFFDLPKINEMHYYGKKGSTIEFPNLWHKKIYEMTFAGRNEAFCTGILPPQYYNDVDSLYPYAMIKTQCLLIKNVKLWKGCRDNLLGKMNWQKLYACTGLPYGWLVGDFETEDDIWGLPVKIGENNVYLTGRIRNAVYHTLDLEAANAKVLHVDNVLIPIFNYDQTKTMRKFETLTRVKLEGKYSSMIEKFCIKNTINCTHGSLGKSHPFFAEYTNIPSYNTALAESHLAMSRLFHTYQPTTYTDTDSFFWKQPVNKTIEESKPYPTLPFQTLDVIPLRVGCRAEPENDQTIIFRAKMYYQNKHQAAFSGWKPYPRFFNKIIHERPVETTIERQVNRKFKTRDKSVAVLAVGRWFIKRECWSLRKLKRILRADQKRHRPTYDSYQLFLDDKNVKSRAWTTTEVVEMLEKQKWKVTRKKG